jgi:hypothetical protein
MSRDKKESLHANPHEAERSLIYDEPLILLLLFLVLLLVGLEYEIGAGRAGILKNLPVELGCCHVLSAAPLPKKNQTFNLLYIR